MMPYLPLHLPPDIQRKVQMARHQSVITPQIARMALNCLDLTALTGNETEQDILKLCNQAVSYNLATVCVLPDKVKMAAQFLKGTGIKVATVINFPYGEKRTGRDHEYATVETTAEDVARAIAMGAEQIDIVQPHDTRPGHAQDILRAARLACPQHVTLKSILETASYTDAYDLANACFIAIASGVDCLKTSTGRHVNGGATLEAAAVLMQAIKKSGREIGVKISGGIGDAETCAQYIALQQIYFGANSVAPKRFRIGGSRVLNSLLAKLDVDNAFHIDQKLASANDAMSYEP